MRVVLLITALVAAPMFAISQQIVPNAEVPLPPPAFKVLRFDEDYSRLANPTNRTDWLDPIKYMPVRPNDRQWYLTFGGELRERVEGNYDPRFGIGGAGSDSYLLQRITLLADLHLGDRVRGFAEGISGIVAGESHTPPPVEQDPIDLQFVFLDVVPWLTDTEHLTLRAGRFGMSFGAGRLVATRAAPNIPSRFDGFEALYGSGPNWNFTAFITRPAEDSGHIDAEDHSTTFWGLYTTHYFDIPHHIGLDLYYFGIHREHGKYASAAGDEYRHSFGVREFGAWNHWDWDAEQVVQFGSIGSDTILAWTAAMSAGYSWDTLWHPRAGLKVGVASGDNHAGDGRLETFDPLFFKSGYFNDASLLRPANIIGLHPNLGLQLSKTIAVDGGADWFWRYSRNDAVYGVPGFVAIPALKDAPAYIGTALDVNLTWQVQRHVTFQASYVHFLTGTYMEAAGGKDVNYFSTTISFLF